MRVTVEDGSFDAYVARPAVPVAPAVIVLQEIFGVNADIRATCDELAAQGLVAIAPDLFWRDAPGLDLNSWSEADWARGLDLYRRYDLDRGVGDITAVVREARTMAGASGKAAVMGFCLGGLMAFLTAARTSVDAAIAYYGGGIDQHLGDGNGMETPILLHFGEEDEFITRDAQRAVREALGGKPNVEIIFYPGQSHAFARHTGDHYDAASAASANARTLAFLKEKLGG